MTTEQAFTLSDSRIAPTRIRLFKFGPNETSKGTFTLTAESAKQCLAAYKLRGADLPLDYDHSMYGAGDALDPAQAGKAAGWFKLSLESDGLYATDIKWSPAARAQIAAGERRYYSPLFKHTDKVITSIINCALTNLPATYGQEPLVAASLTANQRAVAVALSLDPETYARALNTPEARRDATRRQIIALCQSLGIDSGPMLANLRD